MLTDPFYGSPWAHTSRRGWTTLLSFAAQALGVGVLLLLPLIYNEGLPAFRALGNPIPTPAPLGQPEASQRQRGARRTQSDVLNDRLLEPRRIPSHVADIVETAPPPPVGASELSGLENRTARGIPDGVLHSIVGSTDAFAPPMKPVARPLRISRMMEGNLVHRVQPAYPVAAKAARIHGTVVLRAVISKEGAIENLTVISGHPMLVKAALDAVSQWRYRPYLLNGDPFEVETQVTVNFVLH